jgi:hypothetical protein
VVIAEAILSRQAGYLCAARAILIADVAMRDTGKILVAAPGLTSRINADPRCLCWGCAGPGQGVCRGYDGSRTVKKDEIGAFYLNAAQQLTISLMITLATVRSFPMFSLMRRAVTETAAMQGPRVRFGDLRHPQLFDSLKSEITKPPGLGPPFAIHETREAESPDPGINFQMMTRLQRN